MLTGSREEPHKKPLFIETADPNSHIRGRDTVYLNERYVIRRLLDGFHILCFEHDVYIPAKSGAFFDIGIVEVMDVQNTAHRTQPGIS
jgi:hypothetical protein